MGTTVGGFRFSMTAFCTAAVDATSTLVMGMLITSENTLIEIPQPVSDPHADWFFYRALHFRVINSEQGVEGLGGEVNGRSMRKMEELGDDVAICFQAVSGTFTLHYQLSLLLLLP